MRRHAFIQKLAVALIAGQLAVAGVAVWGVRREPLQGMLLRPVLAGARKLDAGLTVEVLAPKMPWHSRHALPLRGVDATLDAADLLALPVPADTVFTGRAGATLRSGPRPTDPLLETYPLGHRLVIVGREALLLDGAWLRDTHPLHGVVLEDGKVAGFIEREALRSEGPTRGDWLAATLAALREGRLDAAQAQAQAASADPFGKAIRDALTHARAHRSSPVIHPSFAEVPATPPALVSYDTRLRLEHVQHLHDGEVKERRYPRVRLHGEALSPGFVATGAQPLLEAAVDTASAVAMLRQGAEVEVLGEVPTDDGAERHPPREREPLPWLEVTAEIIPPVRMEVDLTDALTTGGAVTLGTDPPQAARRVAGFLPARAVSMIAPSAKTLRSAVQRPSQGLSPRVRYQLAAVVDAEEPPERGTLARRLASAWEDLVPDAVAELAVQLSGSGDLNGLLLGAEVVRACAGDGCQAACGLPLRPAQLTARTRPTGDAPHLYLRLQGRALIQELPLTIVATFRQEGECSPEVSPAIASFLYAPVSEAEHDLWIRLPERSLARLAVVAAPASRALGLLERQGASEEALAGRSPFRVLEVPSHCEAAQLAGPTAP